MNDQGRNPLDPWGGVPLQILLSRTTRVMIPARPDRTKVWEIARSSLPMTCIAAPNEVTLLTLRGPPGAMNMPFAAELLRPQSELFRWTARSIYGFEYFPRFKVGPHLAGIFVQCSRGFSLRKQMCRTE